MKDTEARIILGLKPDDDPRDYLLVFEKARKRLQKKVDKAASSKKISISQSKLDDYETAIAVVTGKKTGLKRTPLLVAIMLLVSLTAASWWGYHWYEQKRVVYEQSESQIDRLVSTGQEAISDRDWEQAEKAYQKIAELDPGSVIAARGIEIIKQGKQDEAEKAKQLQATITQLQSDGKAAITGRKWSVAENAYQKIEKLDPGSEIAAAGIKAIKQAKQEEVSQKLFYILGESQAAIEAGRWVDAEKHAQQVLQLDPENALAKQKLQTISQGRRRQEIEAKVTVVAEALDKNELHAARKALATLEANDPKNPNIREFKERIAQMELKIRQRHDKALALLAKAQKLDTGEYSSDAMSLLDEALRLFPTNTDILSLHKKMGAYTRVIEVPASFPTITKALEAARPNDVIRIAQGVYKEALIISKPVRIEGAAMGKTTIQLPSKEASLMTIKAEAAGANISGITFEHTGFDHGKDRYSGVTVMAKNVKIRGCSVHHAAGHGVAIIDGASVQMIGCKITLCGWDGISVYGNNSLANIKDSTSEGNLQNGVSFWRGGSGSVTNSRLLKNALCGISAMGRGSKAEIKSCTSSNNREAGILISGEINATLTLNKCEKNLLSGIVVQGDGTQVSLTNNLTKNNHEAGILIHKGVAVGRFENNASRDNAHRQIWRDADLEQPLAPVK